MTARLALVLVLSAAAPVGAQSLAAGVQLGLPTGLAVSYHPTPAASFGEPGLAYLGTLGRTPSGLTVWEAAIVADLPAQEGPPGTAFVLGLGAFAEYRQLTGFVDFDLGVTGVLGLVRRFPSALEVFGQALPGVSLSGQPRIGVGVGARLSVVGGAGPPVSAAASPP